MAYEHKEGQGSLFKNEKQNDRQPDYKGTILIGGVTYEVAAWERTSQRGSTYLSLQASLPREKDGQSSYQPTQNRPSYSAPAQENSAHPFSFVAQNRPVYSAPMPTADDMPAPDPEEDLPF